MKYQDAEKNSANDMEYDEYMSKIYERNIEKIIKYSNIIKFSQLSSYLSFFIFTLLLFFKLYKLLEFTTFILLIPASSAILSFALMLNMYLKLKDIFDEAQKSIDLVNVTSVGTLISYFCLNTCTINILIYLALLCFRIEGMISTQWNIISIPFYFNIGLLFFYWIMIIPAFFQNKMYSEVTITCAYLIGSTIFFFWFNFKLDELYSNTFLNILIPVMFPLGLHFILSVVELIRSSKSDIIKKINTCLFTFASLTSVILTGLISENQVKLEYWCPVLIFTFAYSFILLEKLIKIINEEVEEKEEKDDINKEYEKNFV
jgi:hypothetical protein